MIVTAISPNFFMCMYLNLILISCSFFQFMIGPWSRWTMDHFKIVLSTMVGPPWPCQKVRGPTIKTLNGQKNDQMVRPWIAVKYNKCGNNCLPFIIEGDSQLDAVCRRLLLNWDDVPNPLHSWSIEKCDNSKLKWDEIKPLVWVKSFRHYHLVRMRLSSMCTWCVPI